MNIVDLWNRVDHGSHVDYDDVAQIPPAVRDLLEGLVGDVQSLQETFKHPSTSAQGISRVDALTAAREHVEAMSTNGRGFQDGVKLSDKVQAVDRFARFLMGESE